MIDDARHSAVLSRASQAFQRPLALVALSILFDSVLVCAGE